MNYKAWVAKAAKQPMVLETVDLSHSEPRTLKSLSIHCGLCHSDLSVLNNEWGISQYPAILGHEVVGRVTAVGPNAKKFSGKYSHRTIKGGIGHNLPQEAPQAFAQAVVEVDTY